MKKAICPSGVLVRQYIIAISEKSTKHDRFLRKRVSFPPPPHLKSRALPMTILTAANSQPGMENSTACVKDATLG